MSTTEERAAIRARLRAAIPKPTGDPVAERQAEREAEIALVDANDERQLAAAAAKTPAEIHAAGAHLFAALGIEPAPKAGH